jgi:hypothetical protein
LWSARPPPGGDADASARERSRQTLRRELVPVVRDAAHAVLRRLYPEAGDTPLVPGAAPNGTRPIASAVRPQ